MPHGIIEKITNGGWGLVRSDEGVVFLNYVLPGEKVAYRVKDRARGILWGELLDVLTPSEHRVQPPCPYFGQCGGCVFQHIDYPFQEQIKRQILLDDLKRIGHYEPGYALPDIIESPPYHNRIRARMKAQKKENPAEPEDGRIGFIRKGTNTVIPINRCLLFPDPVNRFLEKWNTLEKPPFFFQMDIFMNRDNQKVYIHLSHPPSPGHEAEAEAEADEEAEILKRFPEITFSWSGNDDAGVSALNIKEWTYLVSPTAFFQVNPFQWENMLDAVELFLEPCDTIIDLYSGVGFFIPLLKKYGKKVIGVESYRYASDLARRAFGGSGASGSEFLRIPVEKFIFPPADIVVVDPPRSGLSKYVLNGILKKRFPKIIYISCSSATFSRDLKALGENGYRLEALKAFDLFPQTPHLETIGLFKIGG
jgi:23S rRNA (uracil1939-C5)-methyltransferase